jgi:hypothetical protein
MVESTELWLGDFRFMNDKKEYNIFTDVVDNTVNKYDFDAQWEDLKPHWSVLIQHEQEKFRDIFFAQAHYLKQKLARSLAFIRPDQRASVYFMSMSLARDSLSQWRAYGGGEVCLIFNRKRLEELGKFRIVNVEYANPTEKSEVVASVIRGMYSRRWPRFLDKTSYIDREVIEDGWQDVLAMGMIGVSHQRISYASFKDAGFKEERECRLFPIHAGYSVDPERLVFKPGKYPAPCFKVNLRTSLNDSNKLVNNNLLDYYAPEIMFGPDMDEVRCRATVEAINDKYRTNFRCLFSSIPFRG